MQPVRTDGFLDLGFCIRDIYIAGYYSYMCVQYIAKREKEQKVENSNETNKANKASTPVINNIIHNHNHPTVAECTGTSKLHK